MTRVVISQPMYFPWVGFLAQMALADVFIWLDDAKFSKGSFTNRVQVLLGGERKWMSVPLAGQGHDRNIRDLVPAHDDWKAGHFSLLRNAFKGRPHVNEALHIAETAFAESSLCDAIIVSSERLAQAVGTPPLRPILASQLNVGAIGSQRVLQLVKSVGGTEYITGHGARNYLDHDSFEKAGVAVRYMDYRPEPWPQDDAEFTSYVTALDLVASVPPEDRIRHLNPRTICWREFVNRQTD